MHGIRHVTIAELYILCMETEPLIPKHGGYRNLKSFQIAQLCYDVTVRFCNRYIDRRSRTHDQMVQAARSGVPAARASS